MLAHEIAHVVCGDGLTAAVARLAVVLHFYHPLVHWLADRLRLEQELAADALAASIVGGPRAYLTAIGELALKRTDEAVGWPAHAFLPTRRTFLRRIEMLHDAKFRSGPTSRLLRWGMTAGVAVVALAAVGLRPPGGAVSAGAQETKPLASDEPVAEGAGGAFGRVLPPTNELPAPTPKATAVKSVAPSSTKREAAALLKSQSNLRRIMLALHNYESAYQRFPPAVLVEPESNTPRSWRVELLPFLDRDDLYKQYDKNQPWDAEVNRNVLARMPEVYRHASQPDHSTAAAVVAVVGDGLIFESRRAAGNPGGSLSPMPVGNDAGTQIRQITDGLSGTIALVEAKTTIPWTKPEDVVFDPARPIWPMFDGPNFMVAFADGDARQVPKTINPADLKALLTRGGGDEDGNRISSVPVRLETSSPQPAFALPTAPSAPAGGPATPSMAGRGIPGLPEVEQPVPTVARVVNVSNFGGASPLEIAEALKL
ncbi:MAG: M56 family metallopeptidase, partial [Planctomycetia bacterium]